MIRYMPKLETMVWSRKTQRVFEDVEDLRLFVADRLTRVSRYIGEPEKFYNPCDVKLDKVTDLDPIMCWKNYCNVIVDGQVIGYCGE